MSEKSKGGALVPVAPPSTGEIILRGEEEPKKEPPTVSSGSPKVNPNAARYAAFDAETVEMMNEKQERINELERVYDKKHTDTALAKKQFEKSQSDFRDWVEERKKEREQPTLLDVYNEAEDDEGEGQPKKPKANKPGKPAPRTGTATIHAEPDAALKDLWQKVPIAHLVKYGLTEKDVKLINGGVTKSHGVHPMETLGDVARYSTPTGSGFVKYLKDLKGFGDGGVNRYEDAETKFYRWWNKDVAKAARELGLMPDEPKEQPKAEEQDARPMSDMQEPAHPDVAPPKPDKKKTKPKGKPGAKPKNK